jgi:hypothetical protein
MLKHLFIYCIAIGLFTSISAQEVHTPDKRLYEAFGKENVEFLLINNPAIIDYYNYYLDNAFVLVQHNPEKISSIVQKYPQLLLKDPSFSYDIPDISKGTKSINILKYVYDLKKDESSTYWIDKSGIAIVFHSSKTIMENYNKIKAQ